MCFYYIFIVQKRGVPTSIYFSICTLLKTIRSFFYKNFSWIFKKNVGIEIIKQDLFLYNFYKMIFIIDNYKSMFM